MHTLAVATRSRRRLAPETRRQELLDALAAELAETQWHRISVPMVVRRAGASQGLFYRYFGDLDEAFIALVDDRIVPRLSDIGGRLRLDVGSPEAVEAMLTGWFEGLAKLMVDEPHVIKATLLAAPTGAGAAADYCGGLLDELRQWGQGLLEQVNGTGPYRQVDAALVAHMVVGMTVQCVSTGIGATDPARWASEMARFEAFGLLRRDELREENP